MNLAQQTCGPCAGGVPPMTAHDAHARLSEIPGWNLVDNGHRIERSFKFHNFTEACGFANRVAELAEQQGHHPDIAFGWGYCTVSFQTHAINGLHDNDFIMAAKVNEIIHEPAMAAAHREGMEE
jgi:4a-hydroxytetrahydrobiopterin dehydratase